MVGGTPKKQNMDSSFASKLDSSMMNMTVDNEKSERVQMMDKMDELENDILYLQEEVKERDVKVMELMAEMTEDQKLSEDRAQQIQMLQIENTSLRQVAPD